jgi:hypothetical protein
LNGVANVGIVGSFYVKGAEFTVQVWTVQERDRANKL